MKVVSRHDALDEIVGRYSDSVVVELPLAAPLSCGRLVAYRLSTLRPVRLFGMGLGWMIEGGPERGGGKKISEDEIDKMELLVCKCLTHVRSCDVMEDGSHAERWEEVRAVQGEPVQGAVPRQFRVSALDDADGTLGVLVKELVRSFQLQWRTRGNGGGGVPAVGNGGPGGDGEDVPGDGAARVGVRQKRRAGR